MTEPKVTDVIPRWYELTSAEQVQIVRLVNHLASSSPEDRDAFLSKVTDLRVNLAYR